MGQSIHLVLLWKNLTQWAGYAKKTIPKLLTAPVGMLQGMGKKSFWKTPLAFTEHMFHHLLKQPTRAYGSETLEKLTMYFRENSLNMRKLAAEITRLACTASLSGNPQEASKQP
jgi:hypothetical protein